MRVVAVCEQNRKRLTGDWRDIQGNFGPPGEKVDLAGIATYDSLHDLVADDAVDLIDITLPPALHAEITVAALAAGKHVFCEKPLALNPKEGERMIRAAKKNRRLLMVGHVLPFFPEYAWALKTIRSGKYGRLLGGSFRRVISDPTWLKHFWSAEKTGGPMLDLHVHDAHYLRLLFGTPRWVHTQGRLRGEVAEFWHSQFGYDDAKIVVEATSGTIDQQGRPFDHGYEIHLQKATLLFQFAVIGGEGRYLCPPTLLTNTGRATQPKLTGGDPLDAFYAELKEAKRCLKENKVAPGLSAELACDAIHLCQKQTESLRTNRRVRMNSK